MFRLSIVAILAVVGSAQAGVIAQTTTVVPPDQFQLLRGSLVKGELESLFEIDSDLFVAKSGLTANVSEPQIQLQTISYGILDTFPPTMHVHLTSHVSSPNIQQQIQFRNLYTNQWDVVDTRVATTSQASIIVNVPDPFNYITPASGTVVMRTNFKAVGKVNSSSWTATVNQVVLVTPD